MTLHYLYILRHKLNKSFILKISTSKILLELLSEAQPIGYIQLSTPETKELIVPSNFVDTIQQITCIYDQLFLDLSFVTLVWRTKVL